MSCRSIIAGGNLQDTANHDIFRARILPSYPTSMYHSGTPVNTDTEGAIESVRIKRVELRVNVRAFFTKGQSKLSVIMSCPYTVVCLMIFGAKRGICYCPADIGTKLHIPQQNHFFLNCAWTFRYPCAVIGRWRNYSKPFETSEKCLNYFDS